MTAADKITRRLLEGYPDPKIALRFSNPLELLIAVILSAQCTDARVNAVTTDLFRKYRTAADYAKADLATFEQEIRSTGFYRNKAKTVIACARRLGPACNRRADVHGSNGARFRATLSACELSKTDS